MYKNTIEKYDKTTGQYYTIKIPNTKTIDTATIDKVLYELYNIKIIEK